MSQNSDPATGVVLITPSNSANIVIPQTAVKGVRGFYCNVAGDITYVCDDNSIGILTALAGYVYPIEIVRVNSTGTTATGIYGLL
jgi:hypothetical protein